MRLEAEEIQADKVWFCTLEKVITLTISHGVKPEDATYRYVLKKQKKTVQWLDTTSPRIHAIAAEGKILTAAFVEGNGKLPEGSLGKLKPGIALWSTEGKLIQHSDFIQ